MTTLNQQIINTWATHFQLSSALLQQQGTTLLTNDKYTEKSWVYFWNLGVHTVITVAPMREGVLQQVIAQYSADHQLKASDLQAQWNDERKHEERFYALDVSQFQTFPSPPAYTVRHLTLDDQPAFDAFQSQCTAEELDEGEIGLDHEMIVGVLDGERIIAGASMYEWRGFSDIGVITDPAYRRQGLGKVAVSYLCQALIKQGHQRVILYRHDIENLGSQGVARGLNFRLISTIEAVPPPQ